MKLKTEVLFVGLMILGLMDLPGSSFAQPTEVCELGEAPQDKIAQDRDNLTFAVPLKEIGSAPLSFYDWRGFALKDHKSYVLRISIESLRPVGPAGARRFLASNMTIEEIKKEISAKEGNLTYRGHIKVDEVAYWLVNIKMIHELDNLNLDANIADLKESSAQEVIVRNVGHIKVNTTRREGLMKCQGEMTLTESPLIGHYQLRLDADAMPPNKGEHSE